MAIIKQLSIINYFPTLILLNPNYRNWFLLITKINTKKLIIAHWSVFSSIGR